ncbi:MAG: Nif3-like dinuclear metal center hexameric protein [Coprococcus sp.]|nr:Nif3-like dinuclear metal center hexameric protein [Coprococcus sp.]
MLCREIMEVIEERYPKRFAMEWDNVGLQVGRADKEVQKIYLALDATDEAVSEAAEWKADMLITHHPMIFKAMKQITDEHFIGKRVLRLIREDISYYAMHTNYDVMGMADLAGDYLGLENTSVLEVTSEERDGMPEQGIGRIADLKGPMTLAECCRFVKERFALPSVKVFGNPDMEVKRIAVFPGSGKGAIEQALEKGADVLITGDIDHHEGIDAVAQNMAVIDAGHYGVEHIFVEDMRRFCEEKFPQLEVRTAKICHPFWIS